MSIARERCRASSAQFMVTRWHGDTSFSTFRLARGQAGTFSLIFPACPRESKSSEITVISVTLSPRSRLLPNQNSKTYDAKVSHLRCKSQGLTPRNPLAYRYRNKENLWESMSNHEQVWATVNCPSPFPYLCNVIQRYAALPISKTGEDIWWNRLFNMPCDRNQQAVPHYSKL